MAVKNSAAFAALHFFYGKDKSSGQYVQAFKHNANMLFGAGGYRVAHSFFPHLIKAFVAFGMGEAEELAADEGHRHFITIFASKDILQRKDDAAGDLVEV